MRPIVSFSLGLVAALSLLASGALAATKTPHRHSHLVVYVDPRPPLDVNKRSWLDPGPVVPQGTMQNYVTENTIFNQTPDQADYRSRFGNETLPGRFDLPGRRDPPVVFWTPGSPD